MSIELTQAAKDQLDKMLSDDRYMRIALNKTGCCNFTLDFYVDRMSSKDELIAVDGYGFLISELEKPILDSVVKIDYGRKGIFKDFRAVMR